MSVENVKKSKTAEKPSTSNSPSKKIEKSHKSPESKASKSMKSKNDSLTNATDHAYAEKHPFEKVKVRNENHIAFSVCVEKCFVENVSFFEMHWFR